MTPTTKIIAVLGVATLFGSSALAAQTVDARWQAWVGCWAPVADQGGAPRELGGSARVCVIPAQGTSAVEVITIAAGKVVDRSRIEADGAPHAVSREGCTGTETAHWSAAGTRVFVNSTTNCAGGVSRTGRGVLSFTQRYEWLDVRGMSSKDASGVAVARYAATNDTTGIPAEIRSAVGVRSATTNNAILAASAPLTLADIADVATTADSGVAATWLMARTEGVKLSINGKQLAALADQGVPPAVIDVVVAIAHPQVFALNPNSRDADFKPRGQQVTSGLSRTALEPYPYVGVYGYPYGFSYGWSPYSMYGYGLYSPYYGYGYGAGFGYGYGYGGYYPYAGYYPGSQPIIVVTRGTDSSPAAPHGRVVKGSGYEGPRSSGSSSSGSSSASSSGGGGSGGSSAGSAGSSSSGGGGDARTAVRKPPQD